mgnify:FL=1
MSALSKLRIHTKNLILFECVWIIVTGSAYDGGRVRRSLKKNFVLVANLF